MAAAAERVPDDAGALEIKGTVSSLTVLRIRTVDLARVEAELTDRVSRHPQIFQNAPAVIDAAPLDGAALDWDKLVAAVRAAKLVPVASANTRGTEVSRALAAGLP